MEWVLIIYRYYKRRAITRCST